MIYSAIDRGLEAYPNATNGAFLQVSGISYVFDASKPAGKRVVKITLSNGKPVDRNKTYTVATNDYLYNGGDNYTEFQNAKVVSGGDLLKDVLASYIKKEKSVAPKVEQRIKVINERYKLNSMFGF
jgi:5'-nucleotidase / UDP-sugar diphosphatase